MITEMDPKVLAAIVTALVSLLIAILSFIINRKASKRIAKQNEKLEQIKFELNKKLESEKVEIQKLIDKNKTQLTLELEKGKIEIQKSIKQNELTLEVKKSELENNIISINRAIIDIQKLKEILKLILLNPIHFVDINDVLENIKLLQKNINKNYQKSTSFLQEEENKIYHDLKGIISYITYDVYRVIELEQKRETWPTAFFDKVKNSSARLDEMQNNLRDIRLNKIYNDG